MTSKTDHLVMLLNAKVPGCPECAEPQRSCNHCHHFSDCSWQLATALLHAKETVLKAIDALAFVEETNKERFQKWLRRR